MRPVGVQISHSNYKHKHPNRTCINGKPRVGHTQEKLEVARLAEITKEIATAPAGRLCRLYDSIRVDPVDRHVSAVIAKYVLRVGPRPLYIPIDVHREARRLRDRKSEIKRDGTRHAAQANEDAPAVVDVLRPLEAVRKDGIFVREDRYQRDQRCSYICV